MGRIRYDVSNAPSVEDLSTWGIMRQNGAPPVERDPDREFTFYSADELGQFPPVEWLIPGWIAANELTGLFGRGDTYKSFLALTIACQLAEAGQTVVYIAAEGMSGFKARVAAWQVCHSIPSLPQLLVMGGNLDVHRAPPRDRWAAEVGMELSDRELDGPSLVVVDTLARNFVGGDENSARDMGHFVEGCEAIRHRLETAVLVLHHTTKPGDSERGNESLRNASFAMLKADRDKMPPRQVEIACDRMKDAEPPDPVLASFEVVELPRLASLPQTSLALPESFPPTTTAPSPDAWRSTRKMEEISLALEQAGRGLSRQQLVRAVGGKEKTIVEAIRALHAEGHIEVEVGGPGRATIHRHRGSYRAPERGQR